MASENATALAVSDETFGVNPQVSPCAKAAKPSASECTPNQLLEIVIGVARRFGGAKEDVTTHKEYILRLKNEVFKVRFGSVGVFVPVKHRTKGGVLTTKKMRWKEFCKTQFGVTADWINRICGGKAESQGPSRTAKPESETAPYKHGYQAAEAKVLMQLHAAAEKQAALAKRIAGLEKDNEKLQLIAYQSQMQSQAGEGKPASNLGKRVEDINDIETLAAAAFKIINGNFGQRLMGSPEGNRLVEIARRAAAIKG